MPQTVFPCITFRDAKASIDWLERALGAERVAVYEDDAGLVNHAEIRIGESIVMASDHPQDPAPAIGGFALSLAVAGEAEAKRAFDALAEGGSVQMPLGPTFWARAFGMLTDRYGVAWIVSVEP